MSEGPRTLYWSVSWSSWAPYLLPAVLPVITLTFVLTGPHPWYGALPWIAVPFTMAFIETRMRGFAERSSSLRAGWPFKVFVYALLALYFANQWLLLRMTSAGGFFRCDTLTAFQFFGIYSAFSGIVLGHELIHRREPYNQLLGRLACCMLLYEHFYTEHLRGHHFRGATEEDPATARFGESFPQFLRRSIPAQWRSAFQLECRRVGAAGGWDPRVLRSRVVHGMVFQLGLLGAILYGFGPAAVGVFVMQAVSAVLYLEAVNYFQHWGLRRAGRTWRDVDAWETGSRFSIFAMLALPHHAEHHSHMVRPYYLLQPSEGSPRLPHGYLGTIMLVLFANKRLMTHLTAELRQRQLGPFAPQSSKN